MAMSAMTQSTEQQVLFTLAARQPSAALAAEVAAVLQPPLGWDSLNEVLDQMAKAHVVLVADHAPPDIHLESADLRVVALVREGDESAAIHAAAVAWNDWLRGFFSTHRCQ